MKDSPLTIIVQAVQTVKTNIKEELHRLLDRLSPRVRVIIVCGMCTLFIVIDFYYIISGFAGKCNKPMDVEHIESVAIHPEKTSEYDSSR